MLTATEKQEITNFKSASNRGVMFLLGRRVKHGRTTQAATKNWFCNARYYRTTTRIGNKTRCDRFNNRFGIWAVGQWNDRWRKEGQVAATC